MAPPNSESGLIAGVRDGGSPISMSPFSSREVWIEDISCALRFLEVLGGDEVRGESGELVIPLGFEWGGLAGMIGTKDWYRYV